MNHLQHPSNFIDPSVKTAKWDLSQILCKDRHFLVRGFRQPERSGGIASVEKKYAISHAAFLERQAHLPKPTFFDDLPVNQKQEEIKQAVLQNQVVIICGETGSGKTTQLPKLCLALGRGVTGLIGHTQPRRLAARSVANRIAEELNSKIGEHVGFKVRFTDHSAPSSYIKLMTDGILLAETQSDRYLNQYDTIIIDEAHERSLNIDFLLGFLKQLLPRRPDLKVIITSATIDADRFSKHFNGAPVLEVSGRTYPVEVRYRPLLSKDEDESEVELESAIVDAAFELSRLGSGDILVFLAGEREIRDASDALRRSPMTQHYEVLPLFARLSNEEQQRIFRSGGGRRIILATNVAETSLTVPGIHYVIDTGLARVKRYSARAKVEQLHVEKISQAAANQRSGRCGRVAAGVCIRLYDEADFAARSAFTDPEITRSNLSAVILRMSALRLGAVQDFPFIEPPSARLIADGFNVLHELGAVDELGALTKLGKRLSRLPIDPKIGRMLLAAEKHDCVLEMLILVSALSIQDPRERPFDAREAASRAQMRFADKESDFVAFLNLWEFWSAALKEKQSNKQLLQLCKSHFISFVRLREWRELHHQLRDIVTEMKFRFNTKEATFEQLHRALLTGLIGNVGMKSVEGLDYLGARGAHFHLFPGSHLFKAKPKWVVAAELMETTKLYARTIAKINPEWIEAEVPHLVKYHYFDPHWEKSRGEVVASERVTLYGLTVMPRRPVSYGRIDPVEAREIFIRGALVEQQMSLNAPFYANNVRLVQEVTDLEHKSRRQDVLVDDEAVFAFYQERLPESVIDLASFEVWRKEVEAKTPKFLFLDREYLMQHAALHVTEEQFPAFWETVDGKFKLTYRFEPNHVLDGVTLTVPLEILNRLEVSTLEWLVPGMIREKLTMYLKALPKQIRRTCVPVPEFVTQFLQSHVDKKEPILPQLARFIVRQTGGNVAIDLDEWQQSKLPEHCYMNIRVVDSGQQELGMGRDLANLQRELGQAAQLTFRDNALEFERTEITAWDLGTLPATLQFARGKQQLTGFPALSVEESGVALRLFDTEAAAMAAHRQGVIALMRLQLKEQMKDLQKGLPGFTAVALQMRAVAHNEVLLADMNQAICDRAFIGEDDLPRDEQSFKEQISRARTRLPAVKTAMAQIMTQIAEDYALLSQSIPKHPLNHALLQQLNGLIYAGFVNDAPWVQLPHFPRYLKAMKLRMEKYQNNPARDKQCEAAVMKLTQMWQEKIAAVQKLGGDVGQFMSFKWQLQELRVSFFAQELKTPYPVSVKRLQKIWDEWVRL